jgi:hypothetical protein
VNNCCQRQCVGEDGDERRRRADGQRQENIYLSTRRSHVVLVTDAGYEGSCKVRLIAKPIAGTSASRIIDMRSP